jgi:HNH endonuclease
MASPREPWIKIKVGLIYSDKLARLGGDNQAEGDTARVGWIYLLLAAKTQRRMGVFISRWHVVDVLGRRGVFFDQYLAAGLLHVAPVLCQKCAVQYVDSNIESGEVVIHDYLEEQRHTSTGVATGDPGPSAGAVRQARYRLRMAVLERDSFTCRYCGRDDYERDWLIAEHVDPHGPDSLENLVTACRSCNKLKGQRTPEQAGMPLLPIPVVTANSDASHGASDAQPKREPPQPAAAKAPSDARRDASPAPSPDVSLSPARGTTATVTETVRRRKKDVLDEELERAAAVPVRATVVDDLDFSDPNRAGRPKASPAPLTAPPGIAAATPRWRTPCTNYVAHYADHRIIDGLAVCPLCEDAAGTPRDDTGSLWAGPA